MDCQFSSSAPFEGPEKLLELWFAPSAAHVLAVQPNYDNGRFGLRNIKRSVWQEMLTIVKCKILSVIEGSDMDAYLLSESSLFISPHRLILKTCGTTLNLLGLPRIIEIAKVHASLPTVYRCFYSRKSFMFPERQPGPHKGWKDEVKFLDDIFPNGAAYTVGKVNGDHWLLYIAGLELASPQFTPPVQNGNDPSTRDYTIEILMSGLSTHARAPFLAKERDSKPSADGLALSSSLGIVSIFPPELTTLDAYSFFPCGYSSNALLRSADSEGYYTIHVTPEEGWSYASFECNVPLPTHPPSKTTELSVPDLQTLIHRVVSIFQPGRIMMTLFISNTDTHIEGNGVEEEESEVEAAQRVINSALTKPPSYGATADHRDYCLPGLYKRTDKINYEFRGYDLAFASFELRT